MYFGHAREGQAKGPVMTHEEGRSSAAATTVISNVNQQVRFREAEGGAGRASAGT